MSTSTKQSTSPKQSTHDEKDAEIARLKTLLAAKRTSTTLPRNPGNAAAANGTTSNTEEWVHLETRLPIQPTEETEQQQVTQPYEVVLHGQGSLGFQLSRAFVAVCRSMQTAAAEGRLSKLYALSGAGTNATMASPYVLQERAVVLKVEPNGTAKKAGVVVGSSLRALNGQSVLNLPYSTVLQSIRTAARPLRLLFTPPLQKEAKETGDAVTTHDAKESKDHHRTHLPFVSPDTVVLDYTKATPALSRQTEALADVAQELGLYLNQVETTSKKVVDLGRLFCQAIREFGQAIESGGGGGGTATAATAAATTTSNSNNSSLGKKRSRTRSNPSLSSSSTTTSRCLFSNTLKDIDDVSSATRTFSTVMNDVALHLEPFLEHLDINVVQATQHFNEKKVSHVHALRRALITASATQESAYNKRASLKPNTNDFNKIQQLEVDAALSQMNYELVRYELIRHLNLLESHKQLHVLNCVSDTMLSMHGFTMATTRTIDFHMPLLRTLKQTMHDAATHVLLPDDVGWKQKRTMLESSLRRTVAVAGCALPSGSTTGTKTPVAAAALTVDNIKWTSIEHEPGTAALSVVGNINNSGSNNNTSSNSSNTIVYQGYLFTPAGFFSGGWSRAWYFIQNSKLWSFPKANSTNPKLVCDLIVSRVQMTSSTLSSSSSSSSSAAASRYTFEIRTPSAKNPILLQAMDQRSCMEWIAAITKGVETALTSSSAVAAALSNHEEQKLEQTAMTPETFLLQATRNKSLDVARNTITTIPLDVTKKERFVVWEFSVVKGSDLEATISFAVRKRGIDEQKEGDEWVDMRRLSIKCDGKTNQGKMFLQDGGSIEFMFDNSMSLLRNRSILMKLEVVDSNAMNAALAASLDDKKRLDIKKQQQKEEMEAYAQSILSSDEVVRQFQAKHQPFVCADCNAPDPDWVSINLGICICINCSGVHRSLGSHISKIRSMRLDVFDQDLISVVNLVGNTRARKIWESTGTETWKDRVLHLNQATKSDTGTHVDSFAGGSKAQDKNRKDWIFAKYVDEVFLAKAGKRRRFSEASVVSLANVVTAMAVKQQWKELLICLQGAEDGQRHFGETKDDGVDLTAVSPWTILYNIHERN